MISNDRRTSALALAAALAATVGCSTARNNSEVERQACQTCHGGTSGNAAPPTSVRGETATTARGVGAHQAHLGRATFRPAIECQTCHVVPTDTGHVDGEAQVAFTIPFAPAGSPAPAWDTTAATCSVYCHGATLPAGGSFTRPVWNAEGQGHLDCGSCHGNPPATHSASATHCAACHPQSVLDGGTINLATGKHLNGSLEIEAGGACDGCHGAPPDTGAHLAHVNLVDLATLRYGDEWRTEEIDPTGAAGSYSFGCGTCHPKDAAKHLDGVVEVEVDAAGGVAGGLRARNGAGAAYAAGSCSGVYCHSSGQASPVFKASPGWSSGVLAECGDCHGNPPSYPNGGPDGEANSHIFLNYLGREAGHFAGLPGPTYHKSRHGNPTAFSTPQQAAPITCQACHAETINPGNVLDGDGFFFYADTSITTQLPGGNPARFADAAWKDTQCVSCHGASGGPQARVGGALPLRHVNGTRDVAFDPRGTADLPANFYATLGGSAPTRPYFLTGATFYTNYTLPADAGWDPPGAPAPGVRKTLSFQLGGASYEPSTRTCSSVACHLGGAVRWGQKDLETPQPTCTGCHTMD